MSRYTQIPQDNPLRQPVLPFNAPTPSSSSSPPLGSSLPLPALSTAPNPFSYPPPARRQSLGTTRKGKGRAVDLDDEAHDLDEQQPAQPTGLSFCVRFTDGETSDVTDLWVGEKESVREVKRRLRLLRPRTLYTPDDEGSKPRRLRLIQLGRLLPDGVFLVPYTAQLTSRRKALVSASGGDRPASEAVKEGLEAVGRGIGKVVREVQKASMEGEERDELDELERGEGQGKGKGKQDAADEEEQIWLHCSVGDAEEEEEAPAATGEGDPTNQITPLQGFDRLREAGFSDEDIDNLRAEFRERRGMEEEADNEEHERALEEQWMSGMTGQEEAGADTSGRGHYYSLLKGVCIGFFVPFLPLFFFRSQIFTKRMQMAIVLGCVVNLGFGLLRLIG
ncbi:hypothetical protein JCM10207_000617 [Rhodosporidiobolus poonsookiae]